MVSKGSEARLVSLKAFSNYSISVSAATSVGEGVSSDPIICTTKQDGECRGCSIKMVIN